MSEHHVASPLACGSLRGTMLGCSLRTPWPLLLLGLVLGLLALALPSGAFGFSPGPNSRLGLLPVGSCQGGEHDGEHCIDDTDCEDDGAGGVCTTQLADVAIRGVLTLIADKDSGGFDDTSAVPQQEDAQGIPIPADFTKSTLTVMLEFTRNGEDFVLTETYQDLGDHVNPDLNIDCRGFCVPTWREPAVEGRIASVADGDGGGGEGGGTPGGPGVRVQFAPGGAAMQRALVEALGLPAGSVAFLEVVSDTELFDHSREADVLASVRRMKVTIRAILPSGTP